MDTTSQLLELVEHRFDQRRVEGVRDLQPLGTNPVGPELLDQGLHAFGGSGDDRVLRPIGRRHGHLAAERFDLFGHSACFSQYDGHRTARGQLLHELGTSGDQTQSVFEREHVRDTRRHVLAHAMAKHHVGLNTPVPPKRCQRVFQGEQRRLSIRRLVQQTPRCRFVKQHGKEPLVERLAQQAIALDQGVSKNRFCFEEPPPHADVLGALSGEQKCHIRPTAVALLRLA